MTGEPQQWIAFADPDDEEGHAPQTGPENEKEKGNVDYSFGVFPKDVDRDSEVHQCRKEYD
jgi:hypothetical protein